jgi:hypothetical protein
MAREWPGLVIRAGAVPAAGRLMRGGLDDIDYMLLATYWTAFVAIVVSVKPVQPRATGWACALATTVPSRREA